MPSHPLGAQCSTRLPGARCSTGIEWSVMLYTAGQETCSLGYSECFASLGSGARCSTGHGGALCSTPRQETYSTTLSERYALLSHSGAPCSTLKDRDLLDGLPEAHCSTGVWSAMLDRKQWGALLDTRLETCSITPSESDNPHECRERNARPAYSGVQCSTL